MSDWKEKFKELYQKEELSYRGICREFMHYIKQQEHRQKQKEQEKRHRRKSGEVTNNLVDELENMLTSI